jgi:hypothetical protein
MKRHLVTADCYKTKTAKGKSGSLLQPTTVSTAIGTAAASALPTATRGA